jgi:aspartyl-tRNA(Asn)/glutamyl-tRNA(Gln) amidotransferase subunit C
MSLTADDVDKIAHLARLSIDGETREGMLGDLSRILGMVEQMDQVATDGIEPMAHPLHMSQRLRADRITEVDHRDAYQEIAPLTEDGLYLVPKVIE